MSILDQARAEGPGPSDPRRCRSFNLGDAMILVGSTALGLGFLKASWPGISESLQLAGDPRKDYPRFEIALFQSLIYWSLSPMLAAWSIAVLLIRLRRPRPDRGDLANQPGWNASVVATIFLLMLSMQAFASEKFRWSTMTWAYASDLSDAVGPAVAGAWWVLVFSGRWRREPGWIDRLGTILGACWLFLIAFRFVRTLSFHWFR